MAFTGTPVVRSLGKLKVRFVGVSLLAGATGTIGVAGSGAEVILPSSFPSSADEGYTMSELVEVTYVFRGPKPGTDVAHLYVTQTDSPFIVSIVNDSSHASAELELFLTYPHSIVR